LVPGVSTSACGLPALEPPHPADLGVGVDLHLVLPDRRLVLGQVFQQFPQFGPLGLPLLFLRLEGGPGPTVDPMAAMEPAADGLPARRHAFAFAEQQGQHDARPAAAEEAEVTGRLGGHPGDEHGDPAEPQPNGAAALPAGQPRDPLGWEPLEPAVDRAGAPEEQGLDGVPGGSPCQQEEDGDAEAKFGVGVLAVDPQKRVGLLRRQGEHLRDRSSVEVDSVSSFP
jgi:hypothetical protein